MLAMILRRILWMVPTLLVISFLSFALIDLPPGDFLTSRLAVLAEQGVDVDPDQIERIRKKYNLDDPYWKRYLKWMNDLSFFGFKREGHTDYLYIQDGSGQKRFNWPQFKKSYLGFSPLHNKSVSELIGERLLLTITVSICTLLFTWVVAIPIGIYSAVRQYSITDYFFTLLGFIGLATPPFLLALVLMYIAQEVWGLDASGLFSAEFKTAPWSWAKVVDLLQHIWVPVIVLGLVGTASLIRIMRGNLLDELRKQYVLTARAKGLRPIKLLIKYPVRVAINPIISTVGWLLPFIVSGSIIVAVVLNLPTVGPLLLESLLSQDMYLAGCIVMLLAFLIVIGTLISDILLVIADPRIRYEERQG